MKKLNEIKNSWKSCRDKVETEDIAEIISKWTSIPVSKLIQTEKDKLIHLEDLLKQTVFDKIKQFLLWQMLSKSKSMIKRWK